jgi:hypothetical protein
MMNTHYLRQIILEEYVSLLSEQKTVRTAEPRGPLTPAEFRQLTQQRPTAAVSTTATPTIKVDPTSGVAYTTGGTNVSDGKWRDPNAPIYYQNGDDIFTWIEQLSDDFKDSKFYRTLQLIKRDIQSDINSITDPNSEKRKKLDHDINRLKTWTTGLLECWSEWDCFINGNKYGLRPALYTTGGLTASTFFSIFPPTKLATSALFTLLLIDDMQRFDKGQRDVDLMMDFVVDMLGVYAGGWVGQSVKAAAKDVAAVFKNVVIPVVEAGVKGASGAELRIAIQWAKTSGKKFINGFVEFIQNNNVLTAVTNVLSRVSSLLNDVGAKLQDWLRAVYNVPVLGDAAKAVSFGITEMITELRAFLTAFLQSIKLAFRGILAVLDAPGASVDALMQKLGVNIPKATRVAVSAATNVFAISKALEYINEWSAMSDDELKRYIGTEQQIEAFIQDNADDMFSNVLAFPKLRTIDVYDESNNLLGKYQIQRTTTGAYNFVPILVYMSEQKGQMVKCEIWKSAEEFEANSPNGTMIVWCELSKLKLVNKKPLNQFEQLK